MIKAKIFEHHHAIIVIQCNKYLQCLSIIIKQTAESISPTTDLSRAQESHIGITTTCCHQTIEAYVEVEEASTTEFLIEFYPDSYPKDNRIIKSYTKSSVRTTSYCVHLL